MDVPTDHVDSTNQLNKLFRNINTWADQVPQEVSAIVAEQAAQQPPFPTQAAPTGVLSQNNVSGGTGISVTPSGGASGGVVVTNMGVTSVIAGTGIGVSSAAGDVTITNDGVVSLTAQGLSATIGAITGGTVAQRVTTGSIALSTTTPVTLTWGTAFADANYTVVASVVDASGFLEVAQIVSFSMTQVVVNIRNADSGGAHTGTLCLIALHD